jgi:hypothetical protein
MLGSFNLANHNYKYLCVIKVLTYKYVLFDTESADPRRTS